MSPVYKNAAKRLPTSQYRPISHLSVISKFYEAITKKFVDHFYKSNLLNDKPHEFHFSRSSADVLTVITLKISKAPDNRLIMKTSPLDISMIFDKVWPKVPL